MSTVPLMMPNRSPLFSLMNTESENTPTSVGNTPRKTRSHRWAGKHPHERGDDLTVRSFSALVMEPPTSMGKDN